MIISRGENGFIEPITIKQGGANRALTPFLEADTTIQFSLVYRGTVALTLTSTDFDFSTPDIDWTITDTHLDALPESTYYATVYLRHNGNALEEHADFQLIIRD